MKIKTIKVFGLNNNGRKLYRYLRGTDDTPQLSPRDARLVMVGVVFTKTNVKLDVVYEPTVEA